MTSQKNVWIAMIVVAIIAVSGLFFPQIKKGFGSVITATDVTATRYTQLLVDNGVMISAGGINITGGQVNDGITRSYVRKSFATATSSVCSIQSPAATTTLARYSVNFLTSASYSTSYELGQATTAFATTTAIVTTFAVPANTTPVFLATTTVTALVPDGVMPPSTWVNLQLSTTTASATYAPTGLCEAEFISVN